jgi:hypothetical protein
MSLAGHMLQTHDHSVGYRPHQEATYEPEFSRHLRWFDQRRPKNSMPRSPTGRTEHLPDYAALLVTIQEL